MLTLGEAAKHTGVSKSTISRSVKAGRISASIDAFGVYRIDPAELFRVYPAKQSNSSETGSVTHHATPVETPADTGETPAALRAEIEGLKAQLALMREHADDLKAQRDGWQKQASQLLIENQRSKKGLFSIFR